ncbi:MAG: translocase [Bacillota bacterium]|jgi:AAA family ATP:ADP antiporter
MSLSPRIANFMQIKIEELRKVYILGAIFFFIMGSFWSLRALKNTLIMTMAFTPNLGWSTTASEKQFTNLKMAVPWAILLIVMLYSPYVSRIKRETLLRILWNIYGFLFIGFALFFLARTYYPSYFGWVSMALSGCSCFITCESFGAISILLFWGFTNSITSTETAKKIFPFILTFGHLGALCYSGLLGFSEDFDAKQISFGINIWSVLLLGGLSTLLASLLIKKFFRCDNSEETAQPVPAKKTSGLNWKKFFSNAVSGGRLVLRTPYLLGVVIISTFYELMIQFIDYQVIKETKNFFGASNSTQNIQFSSKYYVYMHLFTILISFFLIRIILQRLGTRIAVVIFPVLTGVILIVLLVLYNLYHTNAYTWLNILVVAFVSLKCLVYAVNYPAKEIMWIPTSKEIQFRAKGWIDGFFSRLVKSTAAALNKSAQLSTLYLLCLPILGIWLFAAAYVGRKNKTLVTKNEIIS